MLKHKTEAKFMFFTKICTILALFSCSALSLRGQFAVTVYDDFNSPLVSNSVNDFVGSGLESDHIASILPVGEDTAWVGTINGGLLYVTDTTFTAQTLSNSGIPDNSIIDIIEDSNRDLWVAMPAGGLGLYRNLVWFSYSPFNSPNPANTIVEITLDQNEDLWMASLGQGLLYYNRSDWASWKSTNSDIPYDDLSSTIYDPVSGNLWVGAPSSGLLKIDKDRLLGTQSPVPSGFEIFPNPNWGQFSIRKTQAMGEVSIRIHEMSGKLMHQCSGRPKDLADGRDVFPTELFQFDLDLPAGFYLVEMNQSGQKSYLSMVIY